MTSFSIFQRILLLFAKISSEKHTIFLHFFRYFAEMIDFKIVSFGMVSEKKMPHYCLFQLVKAATLHIIPMKSYSKNGNLPFIKNPIIVGKSKYLGLSKSRGPGSFFSYK